MFHPGPYGSRGFSCVERKHVRVLLGHDDVIADWVLKGGEGGMTTPPLQYVARFNSEGEILGFGWGGYKVSRPWCSLFVGFPSLSVVPSGEQLALLICWRGSRQSTTSRVLVLILISGQSVVVDVEGVGFRPRAVVVGREVVSGCTRISSQE